MRATQELFNHINLNRLASVAAIATLAISAKGAVGTASVEAQGSGSDPVALCETEALYSFAGGEMAFDTADNLTTQQVSANALPVNCSGLIWRTVSVEQVAGPDLNSLTPNTSNQDVYDGLGAFDTTVSQPMTQQWTCGTEYEQQVTVYTLPVQPGSGDSPESQTFEGIPAEVDCVTAPVPTVSEPNPSPTTPQPSTPDNSVTSAQIKQCEEAVVYSFAGGELNYARPTKGKYKHVVETIKANAIPADCEGIVSRTILVGARLGKPGHLRPDTQLQRIGAKTNVSVLERLKQTLKHAWAPGDQSQQEIKVVAIPNQQYAPDNVSPISKTFYGKAA